MIKNRWTVKAGVIAGVCVVVVASFSQVFAGGHWGGRHCGSRWGGHWGGAYIGWGYSGYPYYYNPYYYHRDYVIIDRYDTVVVKKNAAAPQAQSPTPAQKSDAVSRDGALLKTAPAEGDTVTINIPNASGNFTAVKLVKHVDGYTGPQGENYPHNPTVAQLQVLYGN
jgi:hypothetical protein